MHDTFSPLPHMSPVASPHFKTAFCSTFSHFSSWLSWVLPTHCPNLPHPLYPFQSARIYFFSPRGTDRFKQPFFIFSRYSSPFIFKTHSKPNCLKYFEPFFLFFGGGCFFFPSQELCSAIYQGCSWAMLCNTASRQWLTHIFRTSLKGLILGLQLPHFMCAPIRQPEGSLWAFFPIPDFFFCPETDVSNETRDWLSLMRGCFSPFGLDMKTLLFSH